MFSEYSIRERVYQTFWNQTHVEFLKKKEKFSILKKPDTVFVVVNGSLFVEYKWKRLIEVKEIGVGGIFSTYLGRYFNKTADEYKKQEVYNF